MKGYAILLILILSINNGYTTENNDGLPTGEECSGKSDPICADIDLSEIGLGQVSPTRRQNSRHSNVPRNLNHKPSDNSRAQLTKLRRNFGDEV